MSDYVVTYTFHIDERKRPENFPREVFVIDHYTNVQTEVEMAMKFNERFEKLARAPGVVVFLEQNIDASKLNFKDRKFVPWHMITYTEGEVALIIPKENAIPLDAMVPEPEPSVDKKKETIN